MHEYDVTLKLILRELTGLAAQTLIGVRIERWHNVELPEIRQTRVDLLGEASDGSLVHVELQSTNDGSMPVRMLEYSVLIYRRFGRFPRQIVLYVGDAPMKMNVALTSDWLQFSYETVDVRELDGEPLLASSHASDNVIAILTGSQEHRNATRRILGNIAALEYEQREIALKQLLILAGLRRFEQCVAEEARKMPVLNDIMDHQVIGPAIRQGLQQGREEGREEGRGREAMVMVRRLIEKRFGIFPEWAGARLAKLSVGELEDLGLRVFDVNTLEDLFTS